MAAESRCDELRNPGFVNLVVSMQVPRLVGLERSRVPS